MHQSLRRPGFHCSTCGVAAPGSFANAIVGYVRQRNCRVCSQPLWADTRWLPLLSAATCAAVGWRFGFAWALPAYLVFVCALLVITVVDLRLYLIPNRVVYPGLFICLGLLAGASLALGDSQRFRFALLGMAGSWLFYFIVWFLYPKGMGFGDVRLSALIGLMTGWMGVEYSIEAVLLGLVLGAGSGLVLIILRFRTRKDAVPFGPFMAAGALLTLLWGEAIGQLWLGST